MRLIKIKLLLLREVAIYPKCLFDFAVQ